MRALALLFCFIFTNKVLANAYDTASDYLQYGMVLTPFVYSVAKKDNKKLLITAVAHTSNLTMTTISKIVSERQRPDGSDGMSFWSGHTSMSFTSAGLMCAFEGFDKKYCLPSVGLAASVGALRILAKKHHFTDVLVGAYVGFANGVMMPTVVFGF